MTQAARLQSLEKFRKGEVAFLLATDVAARGLDILGLQVGWWGGGGVVGGLTQGGTGFASGLGGWAGERVGCGVGCLSCGAFRSIEARR